MKVEDILDYKLTKLLDEDKYKLVTEDDKKFVLAQAKSKIQAYCHRKDMPEAIYYVWADISIEILKKLDKSLFKVDNMDEKDIEKRVTSIKSGDTTIAVEAAGDEYVDTGYNSSLADIAINGFVKQLQQFRKVAKGCGDTTHGT